MPAPIVLRTLVPELKRGAQAPMISTRADMRDGSRGEATPPTGGGAISLFGSWEAVGNPMATKKDQFQGASGADLTGWDISAGGGTPIVNPKYSDAAPWGGATSALMHFDTEGSGQYNCTAEKDFPAANSGYMSYWVNIVRLSGKVSRNLKVARFTNGYSGGYTSPIVGGTAQQSGAYDDVTINRTYAFYGIIPVIGAQDTIYTPRYDEMGWVRIQTGIDLGTLNTSDGRFFAGAGDYFENVAGLLHKQDEADLLTRITLPYYVASPGDTTKNRYNIYTAEFYATMGIGLARIELSNAAIYAPSASVPVETTTRTTSRADIVIPENIPTTLLNLTQPVYAHVFNFDGSLAVEGLGVTI